MKSFPSCARSAALQIRVIAFITDPPTIHDILIHLGEPTAPPQIAPACGPAAMRSTRCRPGRLRPPSPHSVPRRLIEEARKLVRWSCAQARVTRRCYVARTQRCVTSLLTNVWPCLCDAAYSNKRPHHKCTPQYLYGERHACTNKTWCHQRFRGHIDDRRSCAASAPIISSR